jgi:hypothetical protein
VFWPGTKSRPQQQLSFCKGAKPFKESGQGLIIMKDIGLSIQSALSPWRLEAGEDTAVVFEVSLKIVWTITC